MAREEGTEGPKQIAGEDYNCKTIHYYSLLGDEQTHLAPAFVAAESEGGGTEDGEARTVKHVCVCGV